MNVDKLCSEEVPQKFIEWLLKMGCPSDQVPSLDKISQMCRGQYYMVWRSLMEHVHPKDSVRKKRLRVFLDDVKLYEDNKKFNNHEGRIIVPEQLTLWKEQVKLKEKVIDAEVTVERLRKSHKDILDKSSNKLIQRNMSRNNLNNLQRRIWLLKKVSKDLVEEKDNMEEAKKLSKGLLSDTWTRESSGNCLARVLKEISSIPTQERSSRMDMIICGLNGTGDSMWPLLCEERAAGVRRMRSWTGQSPVPLANRISPFSIIAMTSAIHAKLAMEVMKNRALIKRTKSEIASALDNINHTLSGESCELLVLQSEVVYLQNRLQTMKTLLIDVEMHRGMFSTGQADVENRGTIHGRVQDLDNGIEQKKVELRNLLTNMQTIDKKIRHLKDCMLSVVEAFQRDGGSMRASCVQLEPGLKLDFPEKLIRGICNFFRERQAKNSAKTDISMDLEGSDSSFIETNDTNDVTFADELKLYLNKFSLEKNRKLILDSGQKIWTFETIQSSLSWLHSHWLRNNLPAVLWPSLSLNCNIQRLLDEVRERDALRYIANKLYTDDNLNINIDLKSIIESEEKVTDTIKKRSAENMQSLVKVTKTLDISRYNLQFWSDDQVRGHVSASRTVDGGDYRQYEKFYLENAIKI